MKTKAPPAGFQKPGLRGPFTLLPIGSTQVLLGASDGRIHLQDLAGWRIVKVFEGHSTHIQGMALLPGGKRFVSIAGSAIDRTGKDRKDCSLRLWDVEKGIEVGRSTFPSPPRCLSVTPEGEHVLVCETHGAVRLLDLRNLRRPDVPVVKPEVPDKPKPKSDKPFTGHKGAVYSVAYSPDGKYLLTGGADSARLWDAATGAQVHLLAVPNFLHVCFSGNGKRLLILGGNGVGLVFDTGKETSLYNVGFTAAEEVCGALTPDGQEVVITSDRSLYTWRRVPGENANNTATARKPMRLYCVSYAANGSFYAYGDAAGVVRVHNATLNKEAGSYVAHKGGPVLCVAVLAGKTPRVISGGSDKAIVVRNAKNLALAGRRLLGHEGAVTGLSLSADGKRLASCSKDRTVRVWDLASGKQLHKFTDEEAVLGVAFAPDGKKIASCGEKGLRIWDLPVSPKR
jgi:WD40 repeat protein